MRKIAENIVKFIKRIRHVEYRVAIIVRGHTIYAYGTDRRMLVTLAKRTEDMSFWTLYKKGPIGLPEREVDFSVQ